MLGRWGKRSRYPKDLRDAGRPDDPLFDRPLVYGRIDTGVVTMRRPASDEVEVYHVPAKRKDERFGGYGQHWDACLGGGGDE